MSYAMKILALFVAGALVAVIVLGVVISYNKREAQPEINQFVDSVYCYHVGGVPVNLSGVRLTSYADGYRSVRGEFKSGATWAISGCDYLIVDDRPGIPYLQSDTQEGM